MGVPVDGAPGLAQLPKRPGQQGREQQLATGFEHPVDLGKRLGRALAPLQRQAGEDPVQALIREGEHLRIAAHQPGAAATQGGLRQHAGGEIQPVQLLATTRQRGQEEAGTAAQIQPSFR